LVTRSPSTGGLIPTFDRLTGCSIAVVSGVALAPNRGRSFRIGPSLSVSASPIPRSTGRAVDGAQQEEHHRWQGHSPAKGRLAQSDPRRERYRVTRPDRHQHHQRAEDGPPSVAVRGPGNRLPPRRTLTGAPGSPKGTTDSVVVRRGWASAPSARTRIVNPSARRRLQGRRRANWLGAASYSSARPDGCAQGRGGEFSSRPFLKN
jgi:hypothetical protein